MNWITPATRNVLYAVAFSLFASPCAAIVGLTGDSGAYLNPWGDDSYQDPKSGLAPFQLRSFLEKPSPQTPSSTARITATSNGGVNGLGAEGSIRVEFGGNGAGNFYAAGGGSALCATCLGGVFTQSFSSDDNGWRSSLPAGQNTSSEVVNAHFQNTARPFLQMGSSGSPAHAIPDRPESQISGELTWKFMEENPYDILRGRNYPNIADPSNPGKRMRNINWIQRLDNPALMELRFEPMNRWGEPIDLDCLAEALGVDHFNWLQIIHPPPNHSRLGETASGERSTTNPIYDPAVYPYERYIVTVEPPPSSNVPLPDKYGLGPGVFAVTPPIDARDDVEAYWGEWSDRWRNKVLPSRIVPGLSGTTFKFNDKPHYSDVWKLDADGDGMVEFESDESLEFETELVGIYYDENDVERVKRFGGRGLTTFWRTNSIAVFDVDQSSNDSEEVPESLTGGVFDVLIDVIPDALPGDFNADGTVDAADYVVWRNHLGGNFDLNANGDENGSSARIVDLADYDLWRANFGATLNVGTSAPVPEPSSWLLFMISLMPVLAMSRDCILNVAVPMPDALLRLVELPKERGNWRL